jgi:hypothetical protein
MNAYAAPQSPPLKGQKLNRPSEYGRHGNNNNNNNNEKKKKKTIKHPFGSIYSHLSPGTRTGILELAEKDSNIPSADLSHFLPERYHVLAVKSHKHLYEDHSLECFH